MKWEYDPLEMLGGAHTRVRLSNGQTLWIGVEEDYERRGVYCPAILILSNPDADMWDDDYYTEWGCDEDNTNPDKSGIPTGPGGTEAFATVSAALEEAERDVVPEGGIIVIGGATERLFKIYEHFLRRRGYTRVAGDMIKEVRNV